MRVWSLKFAAVFFHIQIYIPSAEVILSFRKEKLGGAFSSPELAHHPGTAHSQ